MVVDFNEMRLLIVGIRLAADICLEAKDLSRATFYYDQAVHLHASYIENRIPVCWPPRNHSAGLDWLGQDHILAEHGLGLS